MEWILSIIFISFYLVGVVFWIKLAKLEGDKDYINAMMWPCWAICMAVMHTRDMLYINNNDNNHDKNSD